MTCAQFGNFLTSSVHEPTFGFHAGVHTRFGSFVTRKKRHRQRLELAGWQRIPWLPLLAHQGQTKNRDDSDRIQVSSPRFLADYKKSCTCDQQIVPSYEGRSVTCSCERVLIVLAIASNALLRPRSAGRKQRSTLSHHAHSPK